MSSSSVPFAASIAARRVVASKSTAPSGVTTPGPSAVPAQALERTAVGPFRIADALPAEQLDAVTLRQHLQSPTVAVAHLPQIGLTNEQVRAIRCGQGIAIAEVFDDDVEVAMLDQDELVGLGRFDAAAQRLRPSVVLPSR